MASRPTIPSSEEIVREAALELGVAGLPPADARLAFNGLMKDLGDKTFEIYERYEQAANSDAIPKRLLDGNPQQVSEAEGVSASKGFRAGALALLTSLYPEMRRAFLSVSQGRKSRGGKSFEDQFACLLTLAGFPYARQHREYRTDFTLPSDGAFERNRTVCAVASLKRTLRERWQEVAGELTQLRAPNVFLVTADPRVSDGHVRGICDANLLHLVVWDEVKAKKFPRHPRVLGYTQFAGERLPQLQEQWRNQGLE